MRSPAAGRPTIDNWVAVVGEMSPDQGLSPQLAHPQTCLMAVTEIWWLQRAFGIQSSINNSKNNPRGLWHHVQKSRVKKVSKSRLNEVIKKCFLIV